MAAITKRFLHLRPTTHFTARLRHFSSSSDRRDDDTPQSTLNDVRASLQNSPPRNPRDEVNQMLSEFRARTAPPPPGSVDKYVSLHELYERNIKSKTPVSDAPSGDGNRPFEPVSPSFTPFQPPGAAADSGKNPWSISKFTKDLKMKADRGFVSPFSHKDGKGLGFGKIHDRAELGKRLQAMRPEKRKGKWFSLQEMSDRLAKVREAQNKELGNRSGLPHGVTFGVVDGLLQMHKDSRQREKHKLQPG